MILMQTHKIHRKVVDGRVANFLPLHRMEWPHLSGLLKISLVLFEGCHTYVDRLLPHFWEHVTLIHQRIVCCLIESLEVLADHHGSLYDLARIRRCATAAL